MAQRSPRPPRPPLPPRRRVGRILGTLSLLALGTFAAGAGYLYRTSPVVRKYLPSFLNHETPAQAFPDTPHALNLMVIGRDYDYTNRDQIIKSHARSDVLMVAHLDFDRKTISLLSIPRDTAAAVPETDGFTRITKINAAHEFGGPPESEKVVQDTFGIPSDKYVALDPEGFDEAINVLGGVDLTVDRKMDYDDNWGHLHIHLRPGPQHLNGTQAMGFVRFRHADSDFVRIQRQQTLLAALKAKLLQPKTLPQIPALLDTIDKHVASDLSADQKVALANFLHDTPRGQITMATVPSLDGFTTLVPTDWAKATPMIQSIFGVTPPQQLATETERRHHRRRHRHRMTVAALP